MALDDITKIALSALNASMLKQKTQENEETVKKDENEQAKAQVTDHKSPNDILDAMALSGSQNQAVLGLKKVDPTQYLSPERIQDIQESMGVFEQGVQANLAAINQEFGDMGNDLSESYKYELAAQMML